MEKIMTILSEKGFTVPSNILNQINEVASMLWEKGWAEGNAGNISVNISDQIEKPGRSFKIKDPRHLGQTYPELADQTFIITGTGKRMRDIPRNPMESLCLIHIPEQTDRFYFLDDTMFCTNPSSELRAHLLIHNTIARHHPGQKVIFHTHPNDLIALTHKKDLATQQDFDKILRSMHPETAIFLPEGVGYVPYFATGTEELAKASAEAFEKHRVVIWDKHGCLSTGRDVFEAFDLIDLVNKSAQIYFLCINGGYDPEGLSEAQIEDLKERFKDFNRFQ
jgi:rhamnulose-1-phosphate aldolase